MNKNKKTNKKNNKINPVGGNVRFPVVVQSNPLDSINLLLFN